MKATRNSWEDVGMYGGGKGEREAANGFVTVSADCEMIEEEATEGGNVYFCFSFSSDPSLPYVSCGKVTFRAYEIEILLV